MIGLFLGLKRILENIHRENITPPTPTYRQLHIKYRGFKAKQPHSEDLKNA